jgi:hypothetical protein
VNWIGSGIQMERDQNAEFRPSGVHTPQQHSVMSDAVKIECVTVEFEYLVEIFKLILLQHLISAEHLMGRIWKDDD